MKVQPAVKEAIEVYVESEKDTFNGHEISSLLGSNYKKHQVFNALVYLAKSGWLEVVVPGRGRRPAVYTLPKNGSGHRRFSRPQPTETISYTQIGQLIVDELVALRNECNELRETNKAILKENTELMERCQSLTERLNSAKRATQAVDLKSLGINL